MFTGIFSFIVGLLFQKVMYRATDIVVEKTAEKVIEVTVTEFDTVKKYIMDKK